MSYEAVFTVVASLVDDQEVLRGPEVVATELSYWISFILTLQKRPPVIGVILTHKDKFLRQRSSGELRDFHERTIARLRDFIPQMQDEIPFWSIDARSAGDVRSMLHWIGEQHTKLVKRLPVVPFLTIKAGEVLRSIRLSEAERFIR
jgi:hypothetical protein